MILSKWCLILPNTSECENKLEKFSPVFLSIYYTTLLELITVFKIRSSNSLPGTMTSIPPTVQFKVVKRCFKLRTRLCWPPRTPCSPALPDCWPDICSGCSRWKRFGSGRAFGWIRSPRGSHLGMEWNLVSWEILFQKVCYTIFKWHSNQVYHKGME